MKDSSFLHNIVSVLHFLSICFYFLHWNDFPPLLHILWSGVIQADTYDSINCVISCHFQTSIQFSAFLCYPCYLKSNSVISLCFWFIKVNSLCVFFAIGHELGKFWLQLQFSASGFMLCGCHHMTWYLLVHDAILLPDLRELCTLLLFVFSFKCKVMAPVSATLCFGTPVFALHFVLSFLIFNRAMPHNLLIHDNVWYISWLAIFSSKVFTRLASLLDIFKTKQRDCAFLLGPSIQRQGTADSGQPLLCSDCLCQCNETPDSIPSSSCETHSNTHTQLPSGWMLK